MILGACELAFVLVAGGKVLSFAADPLPGIVSAVSSLIPSFDLLQWFN